MHLILVAWAGLLLLLSSQVSAQLARRDFGANDYFAVQLQPGVSAQEIAAQLGAHNEGPLGELPDHYTFSCPKETSDRVHTRLEELKERRRFLRTRSAQSRSVPERGDGLDSILWSDKQHLRHRHPHIELNPAQQEAINRLTEIAAQLEIEDPIFKEQWHLFNPLQLGNDLNVTGLWLEGITGNGTISAVIDDGLDMDSNDLRDNYYAEGSWDFNDHTPEPRPRLFDDMHGTRCAGEIAAVRNNVCGLGMAYDSRVSGIRILSAPISDEDEASAVNYRMQDNHIYSCSWGPPDDGATMDAPGLLIKRAIVNGIQRGRGGLGSVFVFAAGNGASKGDNCNFDGYTNSIYSITVGGLDRYGDHPYYSEACSAQLVVTYSSGADDAIHTTDRGKDKCFAGHGGTSAAGPLVVGTIALALSVRPELTWRDVQYLCLYTAVPIHLEEDDWQDTALGLKFSHTYGYGKVDAYAFVQAAKTWELVKPQAWYHSPWISVQHDIPQGDQGLAASFDVTLDALTAANLDRLEHVTVTMNVNHTRRGDLSVELRSPTGRISYLSVSREKDDEARGYEDWTFMSVVHWGETGIGTWTVVVKDTVDNECTGRFIDWRLNLWGECIDPSQQELIPLPDEHDNDHETATASIATTSIDPATASTSLSGQPSDHIDRPTKPKPTLTTGPVSAATSTTNPVSTPSDTTSPTTSSASSPASSSTSSTVPSYISSSASSSAPSSDATSAPEDSGLLSSFPSFGASKRTQIWIYSAIGLIISFCAGLTIYFLLRRKRTQTNARDGYEFEMVRSDDDDDLDKHDARSVATRDPGRGRARRGGELYAAFAGQSDEEDDFDSDDDLDTNHYHDTPDASTGSKSDASDKAAVERLHCISSHPSAASSIIVLRLPPEPSCCRRHHHETAITVVQKMVASSSLTPSPAQPTQLQPTQPTPKESSLTLTSKRIRTGTLSDRDQDGHKRRRVTANRPPPLRIPLRGRTTAANERPQLQAATTPNSGPAPPAAPKTRSATAPQKTVLSSTKNLSSSTTAAPSILQSSLQSSTPPTTPPPTHPSTPQYDQIRRIEENARNSIHPRDGSNPAAAAADDQRKLRKHGGTRLNTELAQYFPNFHHMLSLEPQEPQTLNPKTTLVLLDDTPNYVPPVTRVDRFGAHKPLHATTIIDLPLPPHLVTGNAAHDPMADQVYDKIHRKSERHEKQLKNADRERAQHEKCQLERLLDELRGPDWLRTLGISGITETEKKRYEPKRQLFVQSEEHDHGSTTSQRTTPTQPSNSSQIDALAAQQLLDEAKSASRRKKIAVVDTPTPVTPASVQSPTAAPSHATYKPFTSFFEKRHLRDAAVSGRQRGRTVLAFGHPVPELDHEADFALPATILTEDAIKSRSPVSSNCFKSGPAMDKTSLPRDLSDPVDSDDEADITQYTSRHSRSYSYRQTSHKKTHSGSQSETAARDSSLTSFTPTSAPARADKHKADPVEPPLEKNETSAGSSSDESDDGDSGEDSRHPFYNYMTEKQDSFADAKVIYQRHRLDTKSSQDFAGINILARANTLPPILPDGSAGGDDLARTSSFRTQSTLLNNLTDMGRGSGLALHTLSETREAQGLSGQKKERDPFLEADAKARAHDHHPALPREFKDPLMASEGVHGAGAGVGLGNGPGGLARNDESIVSEVEAICDKIKMLMDMRRSFLKASLQCPGDNPKDDPDWTIYPPPPEPVWNNDTKQRPTPLELTSTANSSTLYMTDLNASAVESNGNQGSQTAAERGGMPSPTSTRRWRKHGHDIGQDFDINEVIIPGKAEARFRYEMNEGSVYQVYDGSKKLVEVPTLRDYYVALDMVLDIASDGPAKSFAYRRLQYLEGRYNLYTLLNEYEEVADTKKVPHRDFYNVRKVDTHVHHSACMNQKHLLRFIKSKMKKCPDEVVIDRDGKQLTLREVFDSINLTAYDLSIDTLDMHAHTGAFHRFDKFNLKYNPIGQSRLRDIFLKTDNFIKGRYLAEITREVIADLESSKYQMVEWRISIYGRSLSEWDKLSAWVVDNKLFSHNVRWLIQVPRLFSLYKTMGTMKTFEELIRNIFQPLFEVTQDPSSHPKLHIFLQRVIGFDSVDDESKAERRLYRKFPVPKEWDTKQNPPYSYWIYYLYANIASVNAFRKQRGFNTFLLRPHCGEAGDMDHLAAATLCCHSISHGITLRKVPMLQYLFYLDQIGIAMSPLSNNALFLTYDRNPFINYFRKGLNVSLSTDDPLQFAFTKEPLIEEYSVAAQIYKLSAVDMCELAKHSVDQCGFELSLKQRWLGKYCYLPGVLGNDVAKCNVPDVREAFRHETLKAEHAFIAKYTQDYTHLERCTPSIPQRTDEPGTPLSDAYKSLESPKTYYASMSDTVLPPPALPPAQAARIPPHSLVRRPSRSSHSNEAPHSFFSPGSPPRLRKTSTQSHYQQQAINPDPHISGSEPRAWPGVHHRVRTRSTSGSDAGMGSSGLLEMGLAKMKLSREEQHNETLAPTPAPPEPFRKSARVFKLRREVEALDYVRKSTTIPVPYIIDSHLDVTDPAADHGWILMQRLPGIQLGDAWPAMDEDQRRRVVVELRGYLKQLHALQPPVAGWIGSCTGSGPVYDHRLNNLAPCGPFTSVAEFHDYLVAPIKKCPRPEWAVKYRQRLNDNYNTRFTHADLSWENILVDPDTGTITGIIDWEMAGFWPEWWEYRKAMLGSRQLWWAQLVDQVMQRYPAETEADMDIEMF
ncbi:hypothetical protein DV738_g5654, partial [Chaetothyriales sp. CBS 135597]